MTIKPKGKVTVDTRALVSIQHNLAMAKKNYAKFGLLGNDVAVEGVTNAEVGAANEYGTRTQPARPFLAPSAKQNEKKYFASMRGLLTRLIKNPTMAGQSEFLTGFQRIALAASVDVKNFITRGAPVPPPNSPKTVAKKIALAFSNSKNEADGHRRAGMLRTLVDTGRMVQAITWTVLKRGAK